MNWGQARMCCLGCKPANGHLDPTATAMHARVRRLTLWIIWIRRRGRRENSCWSGVGPSVRQTELGLVWDEMGQGKVCLPPTRRPLSIGAEPPNALRATLRCTPHESSSSSSSSSSACAAPRCAPPKSRRPSDGAGITAFRLPLRRLFPTTRRDRSRQLSSLHHHCEKGA